MTTNKIPTDEEIIMNILGCETKDDLIGWENGDNGQFCYEDIAVSIKLARAAGRAEGLEEAAKIAESLSVKSLPNALFGSVIGKDAILAANVIAEAIRIQPTNKEEK